MTSNPEDENEVQEDGEEQGEIDDEGVQEEVNDSNRTTSPFGFRGVIQNLQETIDSMPSFNIYDQIDPEFLRRLRNPIRPELLQMLSQPVVDPEVIRQIQQPVIDPEIVEAIQQPVINQELLRSLRQPAIDPELIETLQTLNESSVLNLYHTLAALEQFHQEDIDDLDKISDEELADELEKDQEPPQQGGVLSTFFNATAIFLLNQSNQFPEESVESLRIILQSESVQAKTDAFRNFVPSAGNTASQAIVLTVHTAFHFTWGLHFVDDFESDNYRMDVGDDENGDDQG